MPFRALLLSIPLQTSSINGISDRMDDTIGTACCTSKISTKKQDGRPTVQTSEMGIKMRRDSIGWCIVWTQHSVTLKTTPLPVPLPKLGGWLVPESVIIS